MGRINLPLQSITGPGTAGRALRQPVLEDRNFAGAGAAQLAQASGAIADVLEKLEKARKDAADASTLAQRVAAAQRSYTRFFAARSQDSANHETLVRDLEGFSGELMKEASKGVNDPALAGAINSRLNDWLQGKLGEAEFVSRKQATDSYRGKMEEALNDLHALAASAPTDEERAEHNTTARVLIETMRRAGVLTERERVAQIANHVSRSEEVAVRRMLSASPRATYEALLDESKFTDLTPQTRATLTSLAQRQTEAAERRDMALADRAERKAQKELEQRQERTEANFRSMVRNNPDFLLSDEATNELERMREGRLIDPTRYQALRDWVDGKRAEGGFDNPETVSEITIGYLTGKMDAREALREITNMRLLGRLTNTTGERLEDLVTETPALLETQDARQAALFVNQSLGVIEGLLGGTGIDAVRVARANQEFVLRVRNNEDPAEVADDIVERYVTRTIRGVTLEAPRFPTPEDAQAAFDAGTITRREYEHEAQIHRAQSLQTSRRQGSGTGESQSSADLRRQNRERGKER